MNDLDLQHMHTDKTLPKISYNNDNSLIYEIPVYDDNNNYINKIIININLSNIKNLNNYPFNITINI